MWDSVAHASYGGKEVSGVVIEKVEQAAAVTLRATDSAVDGDVVERNEDVVAD